MKLNYNSFYKDFANMTLDWLPMDTESLYKKNLKLRYANLEKNGWIDNPFTYKFNSNGFRCDEFSHQTTIMFLGCSHTCGIGLPIDTIWPELVTKELKMKCANLGIGGGSSDTAFRLCHGWIDIIKPTIIVYAIPTGVRTELVSNTTIQNLSVTTKEYRDYFLDWSIDENNHTFNKLKNSLAIQQMCNQRNIKYVEFDLDTLDISPTDYARDLVHYGVNTNKSFSQKVLSTIS
jgi:hypothetical protein